MRRRRLSTIYAATAKKQGRVSGVSLASAKGFLRVTIIPFGAARQPGPDVVLALGGGNAIGAYHLGICEELYGQGIEPGWIVGASIGAVTGAILSGNLPERRLERLHQFWEAAAQPDKLVPAPRTKQARVVYNALHAATGLMLGRSSVFRLRYPGLWSLLPWLPNDVSLYDHSPLRRTIEELVDFDLLNRAEVRLSILAIDSETGEEVWFDNRQGRIGPEHLLASSAIAPLYPPVEIDGRLLCDPGYVNNLPFDHVFIEPPSRDLLCFAVELFSLGHGRPGSLGAVIARAQDISFASHARRSVDALRREYALRRQIDPNSSSITLAHLAYRGFDHEIAAKSFDYSPASIHDRAAAGRRDMAQALAELAARAPSNEPFVYLPRAPEKQDGAAVIETKSELRAVG
jgi:NTE family protein